MEHVIEVIDADDADNEDPSKGSIVHGWDWIASLHVAPFCYKMLTALFFR